jgi:hypothetical protein
MYSGHVSVHLEPLLCCKFVNRACVDAEMVSVRRLQTGGFCVAGRVERATVPGLESAMITTKAHSPDRWY